jgi:hypothetical protein
MQRADSENKQRNTMTETPKDRSGCCCGKREMVVSSLYESSGILSGNYCFFSSVAPGKC